MSKEDFMKHSKKDHREIIKKCKFSDKATVSMKMKFVGSAMTTLKRLTTNKQHPSLNVFRDISYDQSFTNSF